MAVSICTAILWWKYHLPKIVFFPQCRTHLQLSCVCGTFILCLWELLNQLFFNRQAGIFWWIGGCSRWLVYSNSSRRCCQKPMSLWVDSTIHFTCGVEKYFFCLFFLAHSNGWTKKISLRQSLRFYQASYSQILRLRMCIFFRIRQRVRLH